MRNVDSGYLANLQHHATPVSAFGQNQPMPARKISTPPITYPQGVKIETMMVTPVASAIRSGQIDDDTLTQCYAELDARYGTSRPTGQEVGR